jgi:hypothetical protein
MRFARSVNLEVSAVLHAPNNELRQRNLTSRVAAVTI